MVAEVSFWVIFFIWLSPGMVLSGPDGLLALNSLQVVSFLEINSYHVIYYSILISLGIAIGIVVGLSLGLIGGGGSILAVPLLVYLIGLEPHIAIGTSALVVGINAMISFLDHKKKGHVLLKKGLLFAFPGVIGTLVGSYLGLLTPSSSLLILFAFFMIGMGLKLLVENTDRKKSKIPKHNPLKKIITPKYTATAHQKQIHQHLTPNNTDIKKRFNSLKVSIIGTLVGLAAGYFGIGGGFLIVPSLMHLDVSIVNAIGTSLLPISFFGLTTAANYALSGQINYLIAILLICGGIIGGKVGSALSSKASKTLLTTIFSILLITVAIYIIIKTIVW